jgi:hypothetical protein
MDTKTLIIGIMSGLIISLIIYIVFLQSSINYQAEINRIYRNNISDLRRDSEKTDIAYDIITSAMKEAQRKIGGKK